MAALLSLFQKYRSQGFNDLVGQEVVVQTLRNALKSGNPAQVYLFCGPRGTGKTSTARILAKALNCENGPALEPCNQCKSCCSITDGTNVDIIELDAASYTGVDNVRDIIEKVQYAPAYSRFKVYIIDEVHMLSNSSFNALLKTLEEPPAHVVFILCTTHPHKLPPTILSRCQRHDFQHLTQAQIGARVKYVAEKEGMECSDEAAELLARAAEGSMRDALSELGAVAALSDGHISAEAVEMALGLSGYDSIRALVEAMLKGNAAEALQELARIAAAGRDLRGLGAELCEYLRRLMLIQAGAADKNTFDLSEDSYNALVVQSQGFTLPKLMGWISAVLNLQTALGQVSNVRILWEMLIIRLTIPGAEDSVQNLSRRVERLEAAVSGGTPLPALSAQPANGSVGMPSNSSQNAAASRGSSSAMSAFRANAVSAAGVAVSSSGSVGSASRGVGSAVGAAGTAKGVVGAVGVSAGATGASAGASGSSVGTAVSSIGATGSSVGTTEVAVSVAGSAVGVSASASTAPREMVDSGNKSNLGWDVKAGSKLGRPAPKKSATVQSTNVAERVVPKKDSAISAKSVRDSWNIPAKKTVKKEMPSAPPATESELADIQNFWQGFVRHVASSGQDGLATSLREVRRCEYDDHNLKAYLPANCTRDCDVLVDNTTEVNRLLQSYRSSLRTVSFFLEDSSRFQPSTKEEQTNFINQLITMFGAVEVK